LWKWVEKLRGILGIQFQEAALTADGGCQNAFMNAFDDSGFWVFCDFNPKIVIVEAANVGIRNDIF
jgi:hypothetical protein